MNDSTTRTHAPAETVDLTIALAGNANVGKSVIFNALTGMNQTIGNWPGKTVDLAEGTFRHRGRLLRVVDLPGTYSLTAYSEEELVTREYLASGRAGMVVNVVDATVLERNLYFTLQLHEMGVPLVVALNMIDLAARSGILIDAAKLSRLLGVPVVKTAAASGRGIDELVDAALDAAFGPPAAERAGRSARDVIGYGAEVERAIAATERELGGRSAGASVAGYSMRFAAIKLLEGDAEIAAQLSNAAADGAAIARAVAAGRTASSAVERMHGEPFSAIIASERYAECARIVNEVARKPRGERRTATERLDAFLLHRVGGWAAFVVAMFGMFGLVYFGGDLVSSLLDALTAKLQGFVLALPLPAWLLTLLWQGVFQGVFAAISVALPYIVPFYVILSLLENTGYLARIAYLTDAIMHRFGLHGKAFIPIVLGAGCNVPAVMGTRIMEDRRGRFIAAVLATLVPCSARTVVILGLVGVFLGFVPAIALYAINLAVVVIVGALLNRMLPGANPGLIMEMPSLKVPRLRVTARQTWFRLRDFMTFAFPIIVAGSFGLYLLQVLGVLEPFGRLLGPFTEGFLGLPAITMVILLFGILRKELALIMLAVYLHTPHLNTVLTPIQMFVFALIVMLYVPCVSTIAVFRREFGGARAAIVSVAEALGALLLGGLVNWGWGILQLIR